VVVRLRKELPFDMPEDLIDRTRILDNSNIPPDTQMAIPLLPPLRLVAELGCHPYFRLI
jgi:hypothetical protein